MYTYTYNNNNNSNHNPHLALVRDVERHHVAIVRDEDARADARPPGVQDEVRELGLNLMVIEHNIIHNNIIL